MRLSHALGISVWITVFAQVSGAYASTPTIDTLLLNSGKVDLASDTVTLPLRHGWFADGREVWYVLIDASTQSAANALGLVYAPGLAGADEALSTRTATAGANGEWTFYHRTVDFSPSRS